jgi:hypothetical protein
MEARAEGRVFGNALTHVGGAAADCAYDAANCPNNLLRTQMIWPIECTVAVTRNQFGKEGSCRGDLNAQEGEVIRGIHSCRLDLFRNLRPGGVDFASSGNLSSANNDNAKRRGTAPWFLAQLKRVCLVTPSSEASCSFV